VTFKFPALRYRRGFLWLYAVLTVVWIVTVLLVLPPYRLKFWIAPIDDSYVTRVKESKAMGVPAGYVLDHTVEWEKQHKIEEHNLYAEIRKYAGNPLQPPIDYDALAEQARRGSAPHSSAPNDDWKVWQARSEPPIPAARPDDWFAANAPGTDKPSFAQSRLGKSLWLVGRLIGLPAVGYFFLFGIFPWIFRGFRPSKQI
jgi:hypothetical protein